MLKMSGCAFSISSSRMIEYGERFTRSVNCPPSSYPTYPGGEPISFETECFSINSDISKRIRDFSLPNRNSASARATSVLPTPDGARQRGDSLFLADDALVQLFLDADEFGNFFFFNSGHGHAGPARHDFF